MALAFVEGQVKSATASPGAFPAFTNAIAVGQLLVCYIGMDGGVTGAITGITDNKGNTWTKMTGQDTANTGGTLAQDVWYCVPTTGATAGTYIATVAFNAGATNINAVMQYFNGFTGTPTLDVKTNSPNNASSTTATSGTTATTTVAAELIVAGFVHASTVSAYTLGAGYTNLTQSSVASRQSAMESKVVAATGTQVATVTIAAARVSMGAIMTFKDVAAGPPSASITQVKATVTATAGTQAVVGNVIQTAPNAPTLNTPANAASGISTTPTLNFSTTDAQGEDVSYEAQIDTVNTFDSTGSTPTMLAHTAKALGASGGTTTAIDTTGANLVIIGLSYDNGGTANLTDSKGNTWTALTTHNVVGNGVSKMYYCYNPTVGTGHTFSSTSIFSSITVQAWNGAASAPMDVQNGSTATASTLATGSITPSLNGEIVISHFMFSVAGTASVNASLSISDQINFTGGANYGSAMGYILQGTAAAINPTWTSGGGATPLASTIVSFKTNATGPLIDALSVTGGHDAAQFTDVTNGADTDPFASGDSINFAVPVGEILTQSVTYYWRVRAKDPTGSNTFSSWSSTFSFTTSGNVSISQIAAVVTATAGVQAVTSAVLAAVAQLAATVTATGGTQAVASSQNVSLTQVGAVVTATTGTHVIVTLSNGSVTQVGATVTATGGTQAVLVSVPSATTQVGATVTATAGTQAVTSSRKVAIAQVAATVTATGGTQVVATVRNVALTQVGAVVTATGGVQVLISLINATVAQVKATVTATGGVPTVAGQSSTSVTQVKATVTATGGTQTVAGHIIAAIAQVAATVVATGGVASIFTVRGGPDEAIVAVSLVPNPLILVAVVENPTFNIQAVNHPDIDITLVKNPKLAVAVVPNPAIEIEKVLNPSIKVEDYAGLSIVASA